jgi:hypothetical protein
MSEKDKSDRFEAYIGAVSGPVHTGKGDILIEHWDARGMTAADVDALRKLLSDLRARVAAEAPPELAQEAQKQVDKLEQAATAEKPDVSAMKQVQDWFLKHLPAVAGAVTSLVNPFLGKVVEAAGDLAAGEIRKRYGKQEPNP